MLRQLKAGWRGLSSDFTRLRSSPRELWVIMLMVACSAFTYNTMANVMTVFASAEYGYSDVETGEIYGWWGLMSAMWCVATATPLVSRRLRSI